MIEQTTLTLAIGLSDVRFALRQAPFDPVEESQIAALMGQKIAAGLHPDQWVQVWLELHVNSTMKRWPEFRNAVGMDEKGYYWIEKRGAGLSSVAILKRSRRITTSSGPNKSGNRSGPV